jgi:two-component system, sensor histidine kinase
MNTLRSIALGSQVVSPSTDGQTAFGLFQADPDLLAIGVVDGQGAPVGLVERNFFMLKFGSTYGRSLYAGRPISLVMDDAPLTVDADTGVAEFAQAALAQSASDLMRGFIVVSEGKLVGVGSMLALFQAITAENQRHANQLSEAARVLESTKGQAQSAHNLLSQALDAMSEGVAIFDAQERLIVWNSKYAQLHAASADILAAGLSFETLLRHGVLRGQYLEAIGREAEWTAERLLRREMLVDRSSEEQELPDGRCLRIEDTRLERGGCISVAVDITDIRQREASVRLLFESNPVPLAVFDRRNLKLLAANEAARSRYGYDAARVATLRADQLIAPEERQAAELARLGRTEHVYAGERSWTFVTAAGERLRVLPYMHPLTFEGRPATLAAAVDVTVQHQAETALKDALKAAEEADRAKSEFLANMSHELRTPLNGIIGMASVLGRTRLEPSQGEMVEVIRTSGASLQTLLSDVLDLAKIEAGQIDLHNDPVAPASLARHVAKLFTAPSAAKGLRFDLDLDAASSSPVLADSVRLTQILTNLCSNAVKFTDRGCVRLSVRAVTHGDRRQVAFAVADTGIGMTPEARARVFERFAQADGSITRRFGGTGLGLSISQHLASLMGGRIEVESSAGRGSTFYLLLDFPAAQTPTLVRSEPEPEALAATDAATAPAEPERLRVLLVEDHPVNRQVVQLILGDMVDLHIAENGAEGVDAARAARFDIILMDMQMPVLDGVSATRAIRALEAEQGRPRTPIVMLTANALPEHAAQSRQAGADAHLPKPITAEALFGAIEAVLQPEDEALSA